MLAFTAGFWDGDRTTRTIFKCKGISFLVCSICNMREIILDKISHQTTMIIILTLSFPR